MDTTLTSRESRDEKKARELNLPFTLDEIILCPVEEYNEMLARTPLNPAQQALVKDIRRRGKNKVRFFAFCSEFDFVPCSNYLSVKG